MARLELNVDPTGVQSGAKKAEAALKGVKREAMAAERGLAGVGKTGAVAGRGVASAAGAASRLGGAFAGSSNGIRMASLQLGQVAQQGAVTGNYLGALAIQMPDLLLGFGTLGAVAGVAAGALIPLANSLIGTADNAKAAENALSDLSDAVSKFQDRAKLASSSAAELGQNFGTMGDEMRGILDYLTASARRDAVEALASSIDVLTEAYGGFSRKKIRTSFISEFEVTLLNLRKEFDLSQEQATKLLLTLESFSTARGIPNQVAAADRLLRVLVDIYGTVDDIPPELKAVADAAGEAAVKAGNIQKATEDAYGSMISLRDAAQAAQGVFAVTQGVVDGLTGKVQALAKAAWDYAGALGEGRRIYEQEIGAGRGRAAGPSADELRKNVPAVQLAYDAMDEADRKLKASKSRSGGGGASIDTEAQNVERLSNAYRSLVGSLDETLRRQFEFEDGQKTLNEALAAGVISASEYANAMDLLTQQYQAGGQALEFWNSTRADFEQGIASAIVHGESLTDVFRNLAASIAEAALQAALFGSGPLGGSGGGLLGGLLGGLFPSAKGNVFSGGNVVPFASGGVVSGPTLFPMTGGRTGVMGEAGPEGIFPLKRGSDGKLGVDASGGEKPVKIVNVLDPSIVGDYLATAQGERLIINTMRANREAISA
ncbi:phage tail tape measure protein [Actibacterium sp. MT2.3-13A]|uniref:phage tail tape measure protein n=1 Tax=Actibacterium sp. MT2.3-13A TaxID=2828332 RepID=UPI001BA7CDF0|nr:phage tail tape measure protein [Actibacterium sp. MT2.3-13A]